jgi:hypothetical protein
MDPESTIPYGTPKPSENLMRKSLNQDLVTGTIKVSKVLQHVKSPTMRLTTKKGEDVMKKTIEVFETDPQLRPTKMRGHKYKDVRSSFHVTNGNWEEEKSSVQSSIQHVLSPAGIHLESYVTDRKIGEQLPTINDDSPQMKIL